MTDTDVRDDYDLGETIMGFIAFSDSEEPRGDLGEFLLELESHGKLDYLLWGLWDHPWQENYDARTVDLIRNALWTVRELVAAK